MKKHLLIITAILILSFAFSAQIFGQSNAEILVAGKTPLAQGQVNRVIELYEWALAVKFTPGERETFQDYFVRGWKQNNKSTATLLKIADKVFAIDEARRDEMQPKFREAFLSDLKAAPEKETSRFLLGVYERAHGTDSEIDTKSSDAPETETAANNNENQTQNETESTDRKTSDEPNFRTVEGAVKLSDLAGKWSKTGVSASGYVNTTTNAYKSAYGFSNMHEIKPGGAFDYSNFATVSLYGCTTELFTTMKGRASVAGSQVTFTYVSGTVNIKDSCKKSSVDKPAVIEKATYRLERDPASDQLRLCEIGSKSPYCLYKVKE